MSFSPGDEDQGIMINEKIRVIIADDHPLIRRGVRSLLDTASDMEVVAEAMDGLAAIEQYRSLRPDVLLLDLQMPEMDGCEVLGIVRHEFPEAKILVLTTYSKDVQAMKALQAGALGYILKSGLHDEVLKAIRLVHSGKRYLSQEIATTIALHTGDLQLTDREISVLSLVAAGHSNKRIGMALSLSEETIKGYMKIILSKLDAQDRTHAVMIALRRGIIDPPL